MIDLEELAWHRTPLGELSLRRRTEPRAGNQLVYEVKLGDEFLMSSLFTASEEALARLGLQAVAGDALEVVVGGLGLGYTAATALASPRVARLWVVDYLAEIIGWHTQGLVPLGSRLTGDPRCHLVHGDFFAFAREGSKLFAAAEPARRFDAVLLDIDHSPEHCLAEDNAAFYSATGLARLASHIRAGGVFALWSNDAPQARFTTLLAGCFETVASHRVAFPNPYQGGESACTVYVARR